jgi:glycosyltransferase involved in cell wall biosynthesis
MQRVSMRLLYRYADAIVVPSEGARLDLAKVAGLPVERIRRVPSPLVPADLEQRAARTPGHPWLRDTGVPLVLGVGELGARKDFATLLRAFAQLRAQRPARLVILGEGRRRGQLEGLVRELGVADDVLLPGFSNEVYGWMARAAVFAASSRWEGLPAALVEAMALGVPVVSTDCPSGPAELLQGGRLGVLVPVGDAGALSRGLAEMLDQPTPAARLRAAMSEYEVAASAAAYLAVWRGP